MRKMLYIFSFVGLVIIGVVFISLLFFDVGFSPLRPLLCVPLGLFAYGMGYAKGLSEKQSFNFIFMLSLPVFIIGSFTDFCYDNYYSGNDWKSSKGYIFERESGRKSTGTIYYNFSVNKKVVEDSKGYDFLNYFGKGYRQKDSIYVVYASSNFKINDIYTIEEGPDLHARDNIIWYAMKKETIFKWSIIFLVIALPFKIFSLYRGNRVPV